LRVGEGVSMNMIALIQGWIERHGFDPLTRPAPAGENAGCLSPMGARVVSSNARKRRSLLTAYAYRLLAYYLLPAAYYSLG
jgi:hypothetical protein